MAESGLHTVRVWMREDGFGINRLVLTIGEAPSGDGPAESPRDDDEPAEGDWSSLAPSSAARQEVAFGQVGGKFYLAAGSNAGGVTSLHQIFDSATGSWADVAPLPAALDRVQAVALGGMVYYIGGLSAWPGPHASAVFIYNPATDKFRKGSSMPRGRGAGGFAAHNGKIYYAGGFHNGKAVP